MRVRSVEPGASVVQLCHRLPAQEEDDDAEGRDLEVGASLSEGNGGAEEENYPAEIEDSIPPGRSLASHPSIIVYYRPSSIRDGFAFGHFEYPSLPASVLFGHEFGLVDGRLVLLGVGLQLAGAGRRRQCRRRHTAVMLAGTGAQEQP